MTMDSISGELPPPFYSVPVLQSMPDVEMFKCQTLVNIANEVRALRLSIENFHNGVNLSVEKKNEPGKIKEPDKTGQ